MKKKVYKNGAVLIYNKQPLKSTSVCAGFIFGKNRDKYPEPTAHFLEHMFFKQTEKYTFEQLSQKEKEVYSSHNAMTNVYRVTIDFARSNKALAPCFELASEQLLHTKFSRTYINNEKGVIKEELVRRNNDFNVQFIFADTRTMQKDTPYINPNAVLGSPEEIDAVNAKQLTSFRDENFTAKNFAICISGGISYFKAKKLARKYFISQLKPTPDDYEVDRSLHNLVNKEGNLNIETFNFKKTIGRITIKLDDELSVDENIGTLNILCSALNGISGIYHKLLRDAGLVYGGTYASAFISSKPYKLAFSFECSPENVNKIIDKISELFRDLRTKKLDEKLINDVKRSQKLRDDEGSIVAYCNARNIFQRYHTFLDKIFDKKWDKKLEKLFDKTSSEDILNLCKKILSKPENIYVTLLTNPDKTDFYSYEKIQNLLINGKRSKTKKTAPKEAK